MSTEEPVTVVVRLRPESGKQSSSAEIGDVIVPRGSQTLEVRDPQPDASVTGGASTMRPDASPSVRGPRPSRRTFRFDHVFGATSTQEDVYAVMHPLVKSAILGYNATAFAYGSTGSGKTFTMMGTPANPGIIMRAVGTIFDTIESSTARQSDALFHVQLSFVELYNNHFRNLLAPASPAALRASTTKIEVHESESLGVHLTGPRNLRVPVTAAEEVLALLRLGTRNRAVGSTNLNEHSSRSHSILTIQIESREGEHGHSVVRMGKLHLIDLAGSERVAMSGAEGSTLVEAQNINLSLTALGDVLSTLSHNAELRVTKAKAGRSRSRQPQLVQYRNSKLTFFLKDSLGGNSKTVMITALRTTARFYQQSLVTLLYASRAKHIKNVSSVNMDTVGGSNITQVEREVERLRSQLVQRTQEFSALKAERQSGVEENDQLRARVEHLALINAREKMELEAYMTKVVHNQAGMLARQQREAGSLQKKLEGHEAAHAQAQAEAEAQAQAQARAQSAHISELEQLCKQLSELAVRTKGGGAPCWEALVERSKGWTHKELVQVVCDAPDWRAGLCRTCLANDTVQRLLAECFVRKNAGVGCDAANASAMPDANLQRQILRMEESHEKDMEAKARAHEKDMEMMHRVLQEVEGREHAQKLQTEDLQQQIEDLKASLAQRESTLRKTEQRVVDYEGKEKAQESEMAAVQQDLQAQLATLQTDSQRERREHTHALREHALEAKRRQERAEEQQQEQQQQLLRELAEASRQHKTIVQDARRQHQAAKARHEAEMLELRSELSDARSELSDARRVLQTRVAEMGQSAEAKEQELEQVRSELAATRERARQSQASEQHKSEELRAAQKKEFDLARQQQNEDQERQQRSYVQAQEQLQKRVESARRDHEAALDCEVQRREQLAQRYEDAVGALQMECDELRSVMVKCNGRAETAASRAEHIENKLQGVACQLGKAQAQAEEAAQLHASALSRASEEHAAEVKRLREEHESRQQEVERAQREARDTQEREAASLRSEHECAVAALRGELSEARAAALDAKQKELNTMRSKQAELEGSLQKALVNSPAREISFSDVVFPERSAHSQGTLRQELAAAALEGDAAGIDSQLRAAGVTDLHQVCAGLKGSPHEPFLLLHKTVCGFHFHGSKRLVVHTLKKLLEYHADIDAQDASGNTVLHKCLQG
eukprot:g913.t1